MNTKERPHRLGLTLLFAFVVFCALVVTVLISGLGAVLLVRAGIVSKVGMPFAWRLILAMAAISVPVGAAIAIVASKIPFRPIRQVMDSMDRLASGDLSTRVSVGSVMKRYPAFVQLADSFNKMAEELEHTEMLRSDFVNNFSHEFKTPIVSIAGFAKLLKRGNLSPEQQREYLDIIEEESLRLAYMATNVLNLTKVENQTILTDKSTYNLSEQLRSCVLLLEDEWTKKSLDFRMEFDEFTVTANEELLKQVWINLIDNAIKFSPHTGDIHLSIARQSHALRVSVTNFGTDIPPQSLDKIFHKFYQVDESHTTQGNGIGLAIVKRVVELHGGQVFVSSGNGVTTFTVELSDQGAE